MKITTSFFSNIPASLPESTRVGSYAHSSIPYHSAGVTSVPASSLLGGSSRPLTSNRDGNYLSVQSHGQLYSTNIDYPAYATSAPHTSQVSQLGSHPVHHAPAPYSPARLVQHAPAAAAAYVPLTPYAPQPVSTIPTLVPGRPTVDYGFNVKHGGTGGSYSYSTFG